MPSPLSSLPAMLRLHFAIPSEVENITYREIRTMYCCPLIFSLLLSYVDVVCPTTTQAYRIILTSDQIILVGTTLEIFLALCIFT